MVTISRGLHAVKPQWPADPIDATCGDAGLEVELLIHDGAEVVNVAGAELQLTFQSPGQPPRAAQGTLESLRPQQGELHYTTAAGDFPNPASLDTGELSINWPDGRRLTPARLLFRVLPSLKEESGT